MKLLIYGFILLLMVSFVSAEMKVSCEKNSECYLINPEAYCSKGYCFSHDNEYLTIEDFQPRNNEFEWSAFSFEPKDYDCKDCLRFAPMNENWYTKFIHWVVFVD